MLYFGSGIVAELELLWQHYSGIVAVILLRRNCGGVAEVGIPVLTF